MNIAGKRELKWLQGDIWVWMIFILLCAISIIEVYSACSSMSYKSGMYWKPIMRHAQFVVCGIAVAWLVHFISYRHFKLLLVALLHLVAYPLLIVAMFSRGVNNANRWVELNSSGTSFQPSEIAKIALVGFVAFALATFRDGKGVNGKAFKWVAIEIIIALSLIFFDNASTAGMAYLVMFGMFFFAEVPKKYLMWMAIPMLAAVLGFFVIAKCIPQEMIRNEKMWVGPLKRVPTWHSRLNGGDLPASPQDYDPYANLQVTHARIAVATCDITGKGLGNSVQRDHLPQAYSDFIYAIIIEEGGIAFALFVLSLYLLLMWRALRIAEDCNSLFATYLVMGLALMIVVQALINMAVAVGAFPVTGQPLPLVSRGGTATLTFSAYIGIILSVSRYASNCRAKREAIINGEEIHHG